MQLKHGTDGQTGSALYAFICAHRAKSADNDIQNCEYNFLFMGVTVLNFYLRNPALTISVGYA
jgi:hypothetical protein